MHFYKLFNLFQLWDKLKKSKTSIFINNKAGYTATLVACGWAGAVLEKVTRASGQEPYAQKRWKSNSRKSVRWSAAPVPCLSRLWLKLRGKQVSGPEGVDDLCFHTGEFSPPPSSPPSPPPPPPPPHLQAHISALKPISQPWGPNPGLEVQIPTLRPKSHLTAKLLSLRP